MDIKYTAFYRRKQEILIDFSAEEVSSDGAIILLERIERKHKLLKYFSQVIPDTRHDSYIKHDVYKLLKQRVYMLMQGYEDANDVGYLKNDVVFQDVLGSKLASQPSISRFENSIDKRVIFNLLYAWVRRYVKSLKGRDSIIIDIDATDDPTHGAQQLTLYNGFYEQYMYNELFFHDGETGQIIIPVLRPGNSHSNKWYVSILKRVIKLIRESYPNIKITIRADSGFSCAPFYSLANNFDLKYAIGIASNNRLKNKTKRAEKAVRQLYASNNLKHQHFVSFAYKADSWEFEQTCHAKVESTGKGMNVRYFISNIPDLTSREIYRDFYVKRGDTSENRIKEVKNMCYSDRLSCHKFWPNFFRMLLSSLAYEMFLLLKNKLKRTSAKDVWNWQIETIRSRLLKVGAVIKKTKRRVYYKLSKSFVYQDIFIELFKT